MTENDIQTKILNYLTIELGVYVWRNNSTGVYDPKASSFRKLGTYSIKGTSDILGVLPDGRLLAIEVKTAKGKLSSKQAHFIKRVNKNGGLAFVARSVEDVSKQLSEYV